MTSSTEPGPVVPETGRRHGLSVAQQDCLRCIAGHIIPASEAFGMPGADDPAILADMVASLDRDLDALASMLTRVDGDAGGRLSVLDRSAQLALLSRLREADPAVFGVVEAVVARAYYRDARVLVAIGMEPRPPFPQGYPVPDTGWSLLDPVRARGTRWRPIE